MRIDTLTIVGVGLIGGSIGLAVRQRGLARRILGVGRQPSSLERARVLGAIDEAVLDLPSAAQRSQAVLFCTPVDRIASQIQQAAAVCSPGTLLIDAGSTKAELVEAVEQGIPPGTAFVGSHPLAGSELRGVEHANADLFEGRLTVVTPTSQTDPAALEQVMAFWRSLGSRVRIMDPVAHDEALALTSHLTHLTAAALAGILPAHLKELTATGFRDTTRVAAGDPDLWASIFQQNRRPVLGALDRLAGRIAQFRAAMESEDWATLKNLLTQAKQVRDALGS